MANEDYDKTVLYFDTSGAGDKLTAPSGFVLTGVTVYNLKSSSNTITVHKMDAGGSNDVQLLSQSVPANTQQYYALTGGPYDEIYVTGVDSTCYLYIDTDGTGR